MSDVHPSDKLIGVAVIAVSALCSLDIALSWLTQRSLETLVQNLNHAPGTVQFEEGLIAAVTLGFLVLSLVGIGVGYGMWRSKRWAFSTGLIFSVLSAILYVSKMRAGFIWGFVFALLAIYCLGRLTGLIRPPDQRSGQKAS